MNKKCDIAIFKPTTMEFVSEVGGIEVSNEYIVRIKISKEIFCEGIHFSVTKDGKKKYLNIGMNKTGTSDNYDIYTCSFTPVERGLYFYVFSYFDGVQTSYITKYKNNRVEKNGHYQFQLTVYPKNSEMSDEMKNGIIYQIFPDRFNSAGKRFLKEGGVNRNDWKSEPHHEIIDNIMPNNDHFGGNFQGIIEKIPYLKELGVTYIYLNPIYLADSNHKYDVGNFKEIDSCFGGEEEFVKLMSCCKENGIEMILDHVFNHVGENSLYFDKCGRYGQVGAYQNKKSEYIDWFNFEKYPEKYECWWGIALLPNINENCQSYKDYICGENGVIAKYQKLGVKGFRLDVVDELPDHFLELVTNKVREMDGSFIIGEVWEDASNKTAYDERKKYFSSNLLDGVMNYVWKDGIIDFVRDGNSTYFMQKIIDIVSNYPKHNLKRTMNLLSSHDSIRILTAVAGEDRKNKTRDDFAKMKMTVEEIARGKELVKMAYLLSYSLPGIPSLYYGDENLMQGYIDPFNRRTMDFEIIDKEFTEFFKFLGKLRENEVFTAEELNLFGLSDRSICFERVLGNKKMIVCVNRGERIDLPYEVFDLINKETVKSVEKDRYIIAII